MEQKKHPRKLADAIKAKRDTRAKNKNEDALQHAQKEKACPKECGIPTKLQNGEQNKEHSALVFIHLATVCAITKGKTCGTPDHQK